MKPAQEAPNPQLAIEALRAMLLEQSATAARNNVVRRDVRTDWTVRDDVRAKLRASIKRLLVKNGYPPDKQPDAIRLVMEQMETMAPRYADDRDAA